MFPQIRRLGLRCHCASPHLLTLFSILKPYQLFDWLSPRVFGANDMPPSHWPQPLVMAKLLRLFPGSVTPHPSDLNHQGFYRIAQLIEKSGCGDNVDPKF